MYNFLDQMTPETKGCCRTEQGPPSRYEAYNFLDMLQKSGKTNMLNGSAYLAHYYAIPQREAREHLLAWIERFEQVAAFKKLIGVEEE